MWANRFYLGGGSAGFDADVVAWAAAVVTAGGTVSTARKALVQSLVTQLKACGAWALTDDYALYAAENQIQALVTLKRRITQTLGHKTSTDPSFVVNRGFLGNADGAILTGWNPSSGTNLFVKNSARYGFWCYAAPSVTTAYYMGMSDVLFSEWNPGAANMQYGVNTRNAGGFDTYAHGGNLTGWFTAERTASNAQAAYRNGAQVATGSQTTSDNLDNFSGMVLASTQNGTTVQGPIDAGVSSAVWGAPLSNIAMYAAEYAAWRSFMTSVGVP